ncbi:MAG: HdeD family acid-resistance protein [Solirubrobacterales bacterium]|jgi:uncharacterized membrane protein HdeD (DUF308 family)
MPEYAEGSNPLTELSRAWWLLMIVGVMCLAAGVIVVAQPDISIATLAVIAGIFLLVDGIYDVIVAIAERGEGRGLLALLGVLSAVVGIILIRHPFESVVAVALLVGIWLVAIGVVRLIGAFAVAGNRGWELLVASVEIVAGIVIVAVPDIGVTTLALFIAIAFIVRGIGLCAAAWVLRAVRHGAAAPPAPVAP